MRERLTRLREQMIEFHAAIFACFLCCCGPLSHAVMAYHMERGGMPIHDAVEVNCKKSSTTCIKAQVPSIWVKGCMLHNCACGISLDMTTPP